MSDTEELRAMAIALYVTELDAPNLIPLDQAIGCYDNPASTGPHSGDCTHEAHTCLRCVRDEADKKATDILGVLRMIAP